MFLDSRIQSWLLGLFLVSASTVRAEPLSSIWLDYATDEDQSQSASVSLQLAVSEDDSLLLKAGNTRSDAFNNEELLTHIYTIQYDTLRLAPFAVNTFYEYWGKDQELVIHTGGIGAVYLADDYSLGLNLEYRDIAIYSRTFMSRQDKATTSAFGIGPSFEYYWDALSWSVQALWYDYADDLTQLNSKRALFLIGFRTYDRASALNDWQAGTGLQYRFDKLTVGVHYLHSVAALDQLASDSVSLSARFKLAKHWRLTLEVGQVDDSATTGYGVLGVGFTF